MKLDQFNYNYSSKWALFLFSWLALDLLSPSLAQIIPDQTLNHENSVIIRQQGFDKIEGGALRGSNLFHSFQEFNINLGQSVYFSNPDSVTNILTRVTGNNPSNILGTLGVLGQANFYLINPHGIIFGNNARLDIQGSFTATTTPAIRVGDQLFSAVNPDTSGLLDIQPEVLFPNSLFQLADISNNGNLSVNQGQNITLIGNTITQNGLLKAPAGEIKLIGDKIVLTSLSQTDTSSPTFGGTILLGGDKQGTGNFPLASILEIAPNALINASATDDGDGGRVIAWSNQLTRFYGSILAQGGEHGGNGGFVEVSGKNNLVFQGDVNTLAPFGYGGTLLIDPTDIIIKAGNGDGNDYSSIDPWTGNVVVSASSFFGNEYPDGLNGKILAGDFPTISPFIIYQSEIENLSGTTNITIEASNDITIESLTGGVLTFPYSLHSIVFKAGGNFSVGDVNNLQSYSLKTNGSDLSISAQNITIGSIETTGNSLFGSDGGSITLTATNGTLTTHQLITSGGSGNGGNISLDGNNIIIKPINISGTTQNSIKTDGMNGGFIHITANNTVEATGNLSTYGYKNGGNIVIQGNSVTLGNLATNGGFNFSGGLINIQANNGSITTQNIVTSGGAKIGGNLVVTSINGDISTGSIDTQAFGSSTGLDTIAGSINLQAEQGSVTAGNISVAAGGTGGNINLIANEIPFKDIQIIGYGNTTVGSILLKATNLSLDNTSIDFSSKAGANNAGNIVFNGNHISLNTSQILTQTVTSNTGGSIQITGDDLTLTNNSLISTSTQSGMGGNAGNIAINLTNYLLSNQSNISSKVELNSYYSVIGNSGIIQINAPNITLENNSQIEASTAGQGNAGEILITSPNQLNINNSTISTAVNSTGNGTGGNINIDTNTLNITNQGTILASTTGKGNAGNLLLNIDQNLLLDNGMIKSKVEINAIGNSGTITINSPDITLQNSSKIEASTAGQGNAGEILITSPNQLNINNSTISTAVTTDGIGKGGKITMRTDILNLENEGKISGSTYGQGDADSIFITADQLFANNNSQIETITDTQYNAGNIYLTINNSLELSGQYTGLFASTTANSEGQGGDIFVTTGEASLTDFASIAVNSRGKGQGGNITMIANNLTLYTQGVINAETASNKGGNINLTIADLLIMRYGSKITATAGTMGAGGDGGNININANFIVGLPNEDSDITANAYEGNGGQINISTNGIFGLEFRSASTAFSDITASSQFGLSGTVSILTPNVNPAQGLTELPSNLVDASQLIGQNACSFEGGKIAGGSSFTVTGKGGLPPSPTESLTFTSGIVNWSDLSNQLAQNVSSTSVANQDLSHLIVANNNLEKQAFSAYELGKYQDSINLLMTLKNQEINPLKQAEINRNLALIYQQIGDWNQFNNSVQESLSQLNSITESSEKQFLLAQIMDVQAQGKLMTGDYQNSLETWQKVSQIYQNQNNSPELIRSQINEILVLKAMGLYTQSNYQINQLFLKNKELSNNTSWKVKLLTLQGEIARLTGQYQLSENYLQQALQLSNNNNQSQILLSLGNTSWFNKKPEEALKYYQEVTQSTSDLTTKLQGQLNQFNLLIQQTKKDLALQLIPNIEENLNHLPTNRNRIYAWLNLAGNLDKLGQISQSLTYSKMALNEAKSINDSRSESYALGLLGHLYEQQKDYDSSKIYTENALILAENLQANDLIYQWQWQMGRINKQLGNFNEAITAYQQSLTNLKSIRADLVAISSDVQFSFREQVEPIYRQLVDLLLQPNATQEQLIQARQVIESLQLAELDNFFRDACLKTQSVSIDQVDPTASIIYTIVLEDRVEVIASLPNQSLVHYSAPISRDKLESIVNALRTSFTNVRRPIKSDNGLANLQFLYDSLIRPLESRLQENNVKTLVFINDGVLRNIPFSAFYNGENYLIEKYAVALAPSLDLVQAKSLGKGQLQILTGGLTEARQGFSALPGVGEELQEIQQKAQTQILLNEAFTPDNLEQAFEKVPFSVIHLATHGEFSSDADKTFLLMWDQKLKINQLNQLLRQDNQNNRSIDLLVLSACKTATGDSRATLGLAGMAVRAGAKSTLASLWSVSDTATSLLMTNFYQFLATGQYSKAEAFRQAQLQVLKDPRFSHPYYWSAFVLLGNWL